MGDDIPGPWPLAWRVTLVVVAVGLVAIAFFEAWWMSWVAGASLNCQLYDQLKRARGV